MKRMRVKKILNNNAVIAENNFHSEIIVLGNGIGFRKQKYELIDDAEVMKVYSLVDSLTKRKLLNILEEIPFEYFVVSEEIINIAERELCKKLNDNLLISLADHINFTIIRYKAGQYLPNLVNEEIKSFYKEEYRIGINSISIINKKFGVKLSLEEASSIAFHIINAKEEKLNFNLNRIMNGVREIINIIETHFDIKLEEETLGYSRVIIHLKYFLKKATFDIKKEEKQEVNKQEIKYETFYENIQNDYKYETECIDLIENYMSKDFSYQLTYEDRLYLAMHLVKILR